MIVWMLLSIVYVVARAVLGLVLLRGAPRRCRCRSHGRRGWSMRPGRATTVSMSGTVTHELATLVEKNRFGALEHRHSAAGHHHVGFCLWRRSARQGARPIGGPSRCRSPASTSSRGCRSEYSPLRHGRVRRRLRHQSSEATRQSCIRVVCRTDKPQHGSAVLKPAILARVPTLLGNEFAGVPNICADPFARVAGLKPGELRCVPDRCPCVLRGVPRAQPHLALGGRLRCFQAIGSMPLREHSVLIAVPSVDLLVRCQMAPRHLSVVGRVAPFNVGVIGRVPGGDILTCVLLRHGGHLTSPDDIDRDATPPRITRTIRRSPRRPLDIPGIDTGSTQRRRKCIKAPMPPVHM